MLVVVFDHFKSCCSEIVCYISQNVLVKIMSVWIEKIKKCYLTNPVTSSAFA